MAKHIVGSGPFEGYRVYGPSTHPRMIRKLVFLVPIGARGRRTSMSYARYLVCMRENRWLGRHEHVDHIDNDKTNDALTNLQILSRNENSAKTAGRKAYVTLVCPVCGISFVRERRQTHLSKGGSPTKCSRACQYASQIKHTR